jgi:hypothetical protein
MHRDDNCLPELAATGPASPALICSTTVTRHPTAGTIAMISILPVDRISANACRRGLSEFAILRFSDRARCGIPSEMAEFHHNIEKG